MAEKKSFVLYTDYREHIDLLSDKDAGRLFKAIFAVVSNDEIPQLSVRASIVFGFISKQLSRDAKKWEDTVEKRRIAGRKGGIRSQANRANACFAQANQADNVNENDTVNENENESESVNANGTPRGVKDLPRGGDSSLSLSPFSASMDSFSSGNNSAVRTAPSQSDCDVRNTGVSHDASYYIRKPYGGYRNVMLSDDEMDRLKAELPDTWEYYINRLSEYMAQTGKQYQNHLAAIAHWASRDKEQGKTIRPEPKPSENEQYESWEVVF